MKTKEYQTYRKGCKKSDLWRADLLAIEPGWFGSKGHPFWGFEHGPGWAKIIERGLGIIKNWQENWSGDKKNNPYSIDNFKVTQVKEKFGSLRFYTYGGDEKVHGLIAMMEAMCEITCEECGLPGVINTDGWAKCLCKLHRKTRG